MKSFPPEDISAPHEERDPDKTKSIAESMKRDGWKGAPILAILDDSAVPRALTGTHRLAAAQQAGIDVPVHVVDIRDNQEDWAYALREAKDDSDKLAALKDSGDDFAVQIMEHEEDSNRAAEDGDPAPVWSGGGGEQDRDERGRFASRLQERNFSFVRIAADASRQPPKEIQLWNAGINDTDYGGHVWNERSVREVFGHYERRGNPLVVDVEHGGTKDDDGNPRVTAGYAKLELRDGEPWLVFDWSEFGAEQIRSGERRFLSPEYHVDRATGEIVGLLRVSLVADPGTHRARVLASKEHSVEVRAAMKEDHRATIDAALAHKDPADAVKFLKTWRAELDKGRGGSEKVEDAAKPEEKPEEKPDSAEAEEKPEEKPEPASAGAKAPPAKVGTEKVSATADAERILAEAKSEADGARRDLLLEREGARLSPSQREWAAKQPLETVKGLIDATPKTIDPPARVAATRGKVTGVTGATVQQTPDETIEAIRANAAANALAPAELEAISPSLASSLRKFAGASEERFGPQLLPNGTLVVRGMASDWLKQQRDDRVKAEAARQGGSK